jgi:hypothetical protein
MSACDSHVCETRSHEAGGGRAAGWLSLAASPVFALMALLTGFSGGSAMAMCPMDRTPITGMALMYLLMSLFHAVPWVRVIARRKLQPRL